MIKLCNDLTALLISDPIKADVADDDLELEEENEVVAVVDDDICDAEPEKVAKIEIKPKVNLCPEKKVRTRNYLLRCLKADQSY